MAGQAQSAEDWYRQGFAHSLEGQTRQAIRAYREALDLNPEWAEAHHALGALLFRSGQGPEAVAEFRLAERYYRARTDDQAQTNLTIVRQNLQQAYDELGLEASDFEQIEKVPGKAPGPQWQATGTGFLAGGPGTVLTTYHAVKDAGKIRVRWADGTLRAARLVREFIIYDIAVLEMQPSGPHSLTPLLLGDSSVMKEGEPVHALKDPPAPGLQTGKLLAVNALESNQIIFHIGVSTAPGESGGPLFNRKGEVVGMRFARKHIQNRFRRMKPVPKNTSFAIKSSYLKQTLEKVSRVGKIKQPLASGSSNIKETLSRGRVTIEVSP
ncbi:MAG: tetratricopeptide repeat protein [Nitrospinaceae bacterium]|nr:tetratricopeptide repeat protein [Nitrospinaceae bacterium]NIT82641.1 tetratricopeptide repeat protein [Nitrospinaceae bacterium]NIW06431.1 tetratricopeptide repeat protein [Nitrospinaceae bacterium]NIX35004.1 tetratricopeptide repeat protein [Nitrospinaceae bacterium]